MVVLLGLALGARIDVHEASSAKMVTKLSEAADAGAQDVRACGWGWAAMKVTVDPRGTTVSDARGSSEEYVACIQTLVEDWDVSVLEEEAMLFIEANQESPAARLDRPLKVTVLRVEGVEKEALQPLIDLHREALSQCQSGLAGDLDYSSIEVEFGQRDGRYRAYSTLPGPVGRCVEREFEPWKLAQGSGRVRVEWGEQPSLESILGPELAQ